MTIIPPIILLLIQGFSLAVMVGIGLSAGNNKKSDHETICCLIGYFIFTQLLLLCGGWYDAVMGRLH